MRNATSVRVWYQVSAAWTAITANKPMISSGAADWSPATSTSSTKIFASNASATPGTTRSAAIVNTASTAATSGRSRLKRADDGFGGFPLGLKSGPGRTTSTTRSYERSNFSAVT